MFKFKERHKVWETSDYLLELDEFRDEAARTIWFLHFRVDNWSPSSLKTMIRDWPKALRLIKPRPILAIENLDNPNWEKFVRRWSFKPLTEVVSIDGHTRRVYILSEETI
jgi:hypothetical protein